jgi:2-methylcitrate dehydratase PrpD
VPHPLAHRLASYVCGLTCADLPDEVVTHTKHVVAHDLVVAMLGSHTEEAQAAVRFTRGDAGSAGECTVIRRRHRACVLDAAFANAVMIRALRQQSTLLPSGINGGAIMIPVALALAERERRTGREIIAALVAGFDVCAKLDAAAPEKRSIRTSSHVYGTFGAAAVAAKLLQLDVEQTTIALSYSGNLAVTVMAGFGDHQYGLLARNGVTAAYLGQSRAPAPPAALEGTPGFYQSQLGGAPASFEDALATLGSEYEVLKCVCKAVPGGAGCAIGLDILQRLLAEHRIDPQDIVRVVVHRPAETNDDLKHAAGPFADTLAALSSVPLSFAALLLDGQLTARRLQSDFNDPAVLAVARRVEFAVAAPTPKWQQQIEVHTRQGRSYRAQGDCSTLAAPSPADVVRFHRATAEDANAVAQLVAAVEQLETLGSAFDLTQLLAARR